MDFTPTYPAKLCRGSGGKVPRKYPENTLASERDLPTNYTILQEVVEL
jgi:hypothetical protein